MIKFWQTLAFFIKKKEVGMMGTSPSAFFLPQIQIQYFALWQSPCNNKERPREFLTHKTQRYWAEPVPAATYFQTSFCLKRKLEPHFI